MMLASMMTGVKVGDEPSFLPKTMSDGNLSATSIENDSIAGRRDAAERENIWLKPKKQFCLNG